MTSSWGFDVAVALSDLGRADLRALPESWVKTDLRTRRPMIPAAAAVGAVSRTTAPTHGRIPARSPRAGLGRGWRGGAPSTLLLVAVVLLVLAIVGDRR